MLAHLAAENAGEEPMGSFGAVVGATLGDLSSYDLDINGPLLAPGVGAQGATPADLSGVFGAAVRNVVPNVSRGVLRHGPDIGSPAGRVGPLRGEIRAAVATA
jgi:orotidine-5'-phosphate decarboxylase